MFLVSGPVLYYYSRGIQLIQGHVQLWAIAQERRKIIRSLS